MPLTPHVMTGWLDIDRGHDGTATGNAVSVWNDRMGNYNFAQANGAKRPLWSTSGYAGLRGIHFDGTDDVLSVASTFDGATTLYLLMVLGGASQTKLAFSIPDDAVGGGNGLDVSLTTGNAIDVHVKTDSAFSTSNISASFGSQGRLMIETYVNLAATPDVTVVTDDDVLGTTNAGTVLDQDGGQTVLGGFSDGGAANFAAVDFSLYLVLKRPLSIGERRRMRRWARRHHGAGQLVGDWRDGSITEVI